MEAQRVESGGEGGASGNPSGSVASSESSPSGLPDVNRNPVTPKVTQNALGDEGTPPRLGGTQLDLSSTEGGGAKPHPPSNHVTVSMLSGMERAPRLDVLWKVAADSETEFLPQSDASVSNCVLKEILNSSSSAVERSKTVDHPRLAGKKIVDPPHKKNTEKEVNETLSEELIDEKGLRVVQRKSSDEDNAGGGACGHRNSKKSPEQPKEIRETFNWPWHRGNYRLTLHFSEPAFRSAFAQKLLLLKTLQWVVVGGWVLGAKETPFVVAHKDDFMWTLYAATLLYVVTYLGVRSTRVLESNAASLFALSLFAGSLAHILGMLYVYFNLALIPTFVLSVVFTYAALYVLSCFHPKVLDPRSTDVGIPLTISLFVLSIVAFGVVMWIRGSLSGPQLTKHIGDVWFVSFGLALVVATVEIIEMQTVVGGRRVPLDAGDWPLAASFIF